MDGVAHGARRGTAKKQHRPFRWSRLALVIHNWLGLKLFLILAVVFVSGTLAVFRYEIDQLIYPQLRVEPGDSLASLDDIVAAVKRAYPGMGMGAEVPTGVGAGDLAIGILGVSPERGIRMIWVDPYRAIVQGDTPLMTPGFFLASLHSDLFIPDWGLLIVCATAIVLVVSLVTGLIAYRRFWRGFLRRPRFRTLRIAMVDLHKLTGLWSLWFAIVIALTGLWYFWVLVGEPMFGFPQAIEPYEQPEVAAETLEALGPEAPKTVSLDGALAHVRTLYPDFVSTYVSLPEHHGAPIVFHGHRGELLAKYATTIAVDPFSAEVIGANLASEAPALTRIGAMVNPLHYGDFGGLWSKSVWFVFGLALSSLAVTGIVIYWCRTASATAGLAVARAARVPSVARRDELAQAAQLGRARALGRGRRDDGAVLCQPPRRCAGTLCAAGDRPMAARRHADRRHRRQQRAARAGRPGGRRRRLLRGVLAEIRRLWVTVGTAPPSDDAPGQLVQGQPGFAFAGMMLPQTLDAQQRLWLVAEGWDRRLHRASWPLGAP